MDHRCRRGGRKQSRNLGRRRSFAAGSSRKSPSLCVPVWLGYGRAHLRRYFPLMVLFIIFCPIIAAILIMVGAPGRKTALSASVLTFAAARFLLGSFGYALADFQHIPMFTVSSASR